LATAAQPAESVAGEDEGRKRIVISEDLPLTILAAVGASYALGRIGVEESLIGVALAPLVVELINQLARRWRKRRIVAAVLALLLFDRGERALARGRSLVATAVLASAVTIGLFTLPELALGGSLMSDRRTTFFHGDDFPLPPTDETAPRLNLPGDLIQTATGPATVRYTAAAFDRVDGTVNSTCAPPSGSTFPLGPTAVTCTAEDAAGNVTRGRFTVTLERTTPGPLLMVPKAAIAEATGGNGARVIFQSSATDGDGDSLVLRCVPASGALFGLGATTVTCRARDDQDRVATGRFQVSVRDRRPPRLTLPSRAPATTGNDSGTTVSYQASAIDLVDGRVESTCHPASGSRFALGATTVSCSAVDQHGNEIRGKFVVDVTLVVDRTAPELRLPGPVSREASSAEGAVVTYSTSPHDDRDGDVSVSCSPRSGFRFPVGITPVRCTATDQRGNRATESFPVEVSLVADLTPPQLQVPDERRVEATSPTGTRLEYAISADDKVDGTIEPRCTPTPGATFPLGTTIVRCTATDAAGNTAGGSFAVRVVDTSEPALRLPGDIRSEATSAQGARIDFAAFAIDRVDGRLAAKCAPASGSIFALTTTTVTCSARDRRRNTVTGGFTVTVEDTRGPDLKVPGDLTVEAKSSKGTFVRYRVAAFDLVNGGVPPSCAPRSGLFPLGKTAVTCSAVDRTGNQSWQSFTVDVVDKTRPELRLPGDFKLRASKSVAVLTYEASAYDRVDGRVSVVCSPPSGTPLVLKRRTKTETFPVTCSAVDQAKNVATGNFNVTVEESTAD